MQLVSKDYVTDRIIYHHLLIGANRPAEISLTHGSREFRVEQGNKGATSQGASSDPMGSSKANGLQSLNGRTSYWPNGVNQSQWAIVPQWRDASIEATTKELVATPIKWGFEEALLGLGLGAQGSPPGRVGSGRLGPSGRSHSRGYASTYSFKRVLPAGYS